MLFTLAASWVPMDVLGAHLDACDRLMLTEEQLAELDELTCKRILDGFVGSLVRGARMPGATPIWSAAIQQSGRLWDRLHLGGGCLVIQTGPKDVVFESFGIPYLGSRFFRASNLGFVRGIARALTHSAVVKSVRPRTAKPHASALLISWV